ncbi:hypothetical protein N7478_003743 [Penicillium angulare]|uniref:uncharacterized protein n=1 Tax=Penicillium angulare TaxID=116970 RepID=UPI00253FC259|nr:uncharacterized protein N7478_003743 [Penicillium angulare]KAJ5288057.1 hypothetical protein N7478_003743 [Penicillium angulare]
MWISCIPLRKPIIYGKAMESHETKTISIRLSSLLPKKRPITGRTCVLLSVYPRKNYCPSRGHTTGRALDAKPNREPKEVGTMENVLNFCIMLQSMLKTYIQTSWVAELQSTMLLYILNRGQRWHLLHDKAAKGNMIQQAGFIGHLSVTIFFETMPALINLIFNYIVLYYTLGSSASLFLFGGIIYMVLDTSMSDLQFDSKRQRKALEKDRAQDQALENSSLIKTFGATSYFHGRFSQALHRSFQCENTSMFWFTFKRFIVQGLERSLFFIIQQRAPLENLPLQINYWPIFIKFLMEICRCLTYIVNGARRIRRLLEDHQEEITNGLRNGWSKDDTQGFIFCDNVSVSRDQKTILRNITFRAHPSETIAIVGESGSGKSTILDLIVWQSSVQSGGVKIDGFNISGLESPELLTGIIAYVPANKFLVENRSIMFNLTLGKDYDIQDIHRACRSAMIYGVINNLEKGFETVVPEDANLSAGERQRIALARALLTEPYVLVLDEFTSLIDAETEKKVCGEVKRLQCTTLISTNRIATAKVADRILVVERGKLLKREPTMSLRK